MATNAKRMRYDNDLDYEVSSSESESFDDEYAVRGKKISERPGRKPKSFSKNALLARENRLKKKLYMVDLETEVRSLRSNNKKLSAVVENQSQLITELKKELKYLKSVIVNSSDISRLMRNINNSSGMSVSSSLDENLSLNNVCIPKLSRPVSRKVPHPWEDIKPLDDYLKPESNFMPSPDQGLCDDFDNDIFNDINLDLPFDLPQEDDVDVTVDHEEKGYRVNIGRSELLRESLQYYFPILIPIYTSQNEIVKRPIPMKTTVTGT